MPKHHRPHHFVVLVRKNVAVVYESRELHQLVLGHAEIGVFTYSRVVARGGPPHAQHVDCVRRHQRGIFPSPAVGLNAAAGICADIFIDRVERTALNEVAVIAVISCQTVKPAVSVIDDILAHVVSHQLEHLQNLLILHIPQVAAEF